MYLNHIFMVHGEIKFRKVLSLAFVEIMKRSRLTFFQLQQVQSQDRNCFHTYSVKTRGIWEVSIC